MPLSLRRVLALIIAVAALSACAAKGPAFEHPAVMALAELLEIRSKGTTDPAAYRRFVSETEVAGVLAEDAVDRADGGSPIPRWSSPYVSAVGTDGAMSVVVVWRRPSDHEGWPRAHRFILVEKDGSWRVSDAVPIEDETVPGPLEGPIP